MNGWMDEWMDGWMDLSYRVMNRLLFSPTYRLIDSMRIQI